jgi:hypothetical protein
MSGPARALAWACLLAAALLAAGCASAPRARPMAQDIALAVAGFTQPEHAWQLLAGYIPEDQGLADEKSLDALDAELAALLAGETERSFVGPAVTRRCQEIVTFRDKAGRGAALDYWVQVGRCVPADYLLVPQLVHWQTRDGGAMGASRPAAVVMDLYVVDVDNASIVSRYHFDETQASLSENLLDLGTFFSRGAKWLTARELAAEGLRQGIKELGL